MSEILYTGHLFRGLDAFRLVRLLLKKGFNKWFNEGPKGGACHFFAYGNNGRKPLREQWSEGFFLTGTLVIVGGEY